MLDIEEPRSLASYLRGAGLIGAREEPVVERLGGGVSARVVLVRRPGGEELVLKQALEKLRVAGTWTSDPRRVHCEAAGLRVLRDLGVSVPELVFEDFENHVIAMTAVPRPHECWKRLLLAGDVRDEHVLGFARMLATIHATSARRLAALGELDDRCGYFESLRLEPYYRYTARAVPEAAAFYEALIRDTTATRCTLVHGDYSPKNVLVRPDGLVLVDHEVAHLGDPAFDVGFALTHLISKANHLSAHRPLFLSAVRRFWGAYAGRVGAESWTAGLEERSVRHAVGCLLARVAGRSPLEYLARAERALQRAITIPLTRTPPVSMEGLIAAFARGLE